MANEGQIRKKTVIPLWDDDSFGVTQASKGRADIPKIKDIKWDVELYTGLRWLPTYCINQIEQTDDKKLVVRALLSAVMWVFQEDKNPVKKGVIRPFSGFEPLTPPAPGEDKEMVDDSENLATNFSGGGTITAGQWRDLIDIDEDELASYLGILCFCIGKQPTQENMTAFNKNRARAATAAVIVEPKIFTEGSSFFTLEVLRKINGSFTAYSSVREHFIRYLAIKIGDLDEGRQSSFARMFMLVADYGVGALAIIKEATMMYEWLEGREDARGTVVKSEFPHLKHSFLAAARGQESIRKAEPYLQPFVKVMFGERFVPEPPANYRRAFAVCKRIMMYSQKTLRRFGGDDPTDEEIRKIQEMFGDLESDSDSDE